MFSIFGFIYKEIKKRKVKRRFNDHSILLSFDDGPDIRYTDELLDVLKAEEVKAVFFVVAEKAAKYPDVIQRIKNEGHRIEFHSLDHRRMFYPGIKSAEKYLEKGLDLLRASGVEAEYFRPPWGMMNPFYLAAVRRKGLKLCFWSAMAQDWRRDSKVPEMRYKLLRRTIDGGLICLHDSGEGTGGSAGAPGRMIPALRQYIESRKACGYEFISFEQAIEKGLV